MGLQKKSLRDRLGYRSSSREELEKRAKGSFEGGDFYLKEGLKFFPALEEGKAYLIRFLPGTWEEVTEHNYGYEIWVHNNIGPNNGKYLCLKKMKNQPCPICEEMESTSDSEIKKKLRPQRRYVCYLIDRDHEKDGPLLWSITVSRDKKFAEQSYSKRTGEVYDYADPDEGYDVEFFGGDASFPGEDKKLVSYVDVSGIRPVKDPSRLENEEWIDFILKNPIPTQLKFYPYEYIKKHFSGEDSEKGEEEPVSGSVTDRMSSEALEETWEALHEASLEELFDFALSKEMDKESLMEYSDVTALADDLCKLLEIKKSNTERTVAEDLRERLRRNRK